MKQTIAFLALVLIGFTAGIPAASAREGHSRQDGYGRSGYSVEGRIRYDSRGNAYWDQGRGGGSSRGDRNDFHRSDYGRNSRNPYASCGSASGRIRYDRQGVAYWEGAC
jgi:hypothetical protein